MPPWVILKKSHLSIDVKHFSCLFYKQGINPCVWSEPHRTHVLWRLNGGETIALVVLLHCLPTLRQILLATLLAAAAHTNLFTGMVWLAGKANTDWVLAEHFPSPVQKKSTILLVCQFTEPLAGTTEKLCRNFKDKVHGSLRWQVESHTKYTVAGCR